MPENTEENTPNQPEEQAPKAEEKGVNLRLIEDEMKQSYLDYAMSVIVSRALPDVRDGLKPVHRRILYAMYDMGMLHNKPFKKSARIVGEVLGKYHPHGDSAVYDTMARMAQDFSLRYPLIDGQGNWGSIDGDSAAAMRYTEARLRKISEDMLIDIDKETVKFVPNFDESLKEPSVLPSKLPNLLINGSSGIAVGMATNIPPHNLKEVCSGVVSLIDNPEKEFEEIMEHIHGPDFPTGGIILGTNGIKRAYAAGQGKIKVRAKTAIEEKAGRRSIIINEVPYMVNKAMLVEQIAELVKNKIITDISDLRDESDRDGVRVVIELKKDANSDVILNQLFKHSRMQVTFGINMLGLVNNEPKTLGIVEIIKEFIKHRQDVVRKATEFDLRKAEEKAHLLEGLKIALDNIDEVIKLIKSSKSVDPAREGLITRFSLSKVQAQAILDMRLQKLTGLEQDKIKKELEETLKRIEYLKEILASEERILNIIKKDCAELMEKYGDERKTEIEEVDDEEEDFDIADLIEEHKTVVTITHLGYIKRLPLSTYKQQHRGGKGVIATDIREGDFVEHLFVCSSHSHILFFTDKGQVHWLKVYQIPEGSRQAKGKAIVNLMGIGEGEKVTAAIPVREFDDNHNLIMATRKGIVKKTNLIYYSRPRKGGIKAIILDEDDALINVMKTDGNQQILLATRNGLAVKFNEKDARPIGRTARGVIGVRLRGDDEVMGMVAGDDNKALLTVTEKGFGKRTKISEYRLINRGGSGVINIKCNNKNGRVVSVMTVEDDNEVMFISQKGIIIRTIVHGISIIGRNTQGVRIMRLKSEDDKVVASAQIISEKTEEEVMEKETKEREENEEKEEAKLEDEPDAVERQKIKKERDMLEEAKKDDGMIFPTENGANEKTNGNSSMFDDVKNIQKMVKKNKQLRDGYI